MSNKTYSPREVAVAILDRTRELISKAKLLKSNTSHELEVGSEPESDAQCPEYLLPENASKETKTKKKKILGQEGVQTEGSEESEPKEDSSEDQTEDAQEEESEDTSDNDEEDKKEESSDSKPKFEKGKKPSFGKAEKLWQFVEMKKSAESEKCVPMMKARVDEGKAPKQKSDDRNQRNLREVVSTRSGTGTVGIPDSGKSNVHSDVGFKGRSVQGLKVVNAVEAKKRGDLKEAKNLISSAKNMHQHKLSDIKSVKPNLPKSENVEKCGDMKQMKKNDAFKEQIPGGLGKGKNPKSFDQKQLLAGTNVEVEHTNNVMMAMEIAMDHLTEKPDYYVKLKQVEKNEKK